MKDSTTNFKLAKNASARERRTVEALFRVNRFISAVGDMHQLLELIMKESKEAMDCDASSLMLFDEESNELFFEVAQGPKGAGVKEIRLSLGEGIAGACASDRKTVIVEDVESDPRHYKKADEQSTYHTRNILATTMVRGERLIGVLEVLNKNKGAKFTEEDVQLLEFFADQAAIAIENAFLIREKVEAERLAAFGVAIAGISHYIKNVLAGIMGSSSLIDMGFEAENYKLIKDAWPVMKRSNNKISDLVQDMLNYSKRREPEWQDGNLNSVLHDVYENQLERSRELNVELMLDMQDELPDSQFDPRALCDSVLNLCGNAVEACADLQNVKVTLKSEYDAEKDQFHIAVIDNGPGIPEAIQSKIFDAFFSTKGSKGTGLGLAVTRKVIEEHGGQLVLESEEKVGTAFHLYIPGRKPSYES